MAEQNYAICDGKMSRRISEYKIKEKEKNEYKGRG